MQGDLRAWLDAATGTDEEFVDRLWPLVLRRPPEPEGRERALAKLREGTLSRARLLQELVESDEFGRVALLGDVRGLPFPAASFDVAFCISTLEHVGRDNEIYKVDAKRDGAGDEAALRELRRVLSKDGRLLVSVPTGEYEDQGWQIVRAPED